MDCRLLVQYRKTDWSHMSLYSWNGNTDQYSYLLCVCCDHSLCCHLRTAVTSFICHIIVCVCRWRGCKANWRNNGWEYKCIWLYKKKIKVLTKTDADMAWVWNANWSILNLMFRSSVWNQCDWIQSIKFNIEAHYSSSTGQKSNGCD